MYVQWYRNISAPFRSAKAMRAINLLDKSLVALFAIAYIAGIAVPAVALLAGGQHPDVARIARFIAVPAAAFAAVTIVRALIDAPRPYELYSIDPIVQKGTRGKSMPSRHMASAVVITCALWWLLFPNPVGILLCVFLTCACAALAFCRIVGGVHFPRDIVAAAVAALACALIGFALIP